MSLRYVLVSFVFMGFVFYELSGGAQFAPPERPRTEQTATVARAERSTDSPYAAVTAASLVTRAVRQEPVSNDSAQNTVTALSAAETAPGQPPAKADYPGQTVPAQLANSASTIGATTVSFLPARTTGQLQISSLEGGLSAISSAPAPADTAQTPETAQDQSAYAADRRRIRASRVNMRQGPGTSYPIIARLLAEDEVIVLEDNGTGWLQLRSVSNDDIGWIAASLVTKRAP